MKNRVVAALGAALLGAWSIGLAVVHAALPLTPTVLGTGYPTPIGIDWLSPSNQLLISDNWNTGVPKNFETVNRVSGAHAVWGSQAGFTDEIYFATVRPGQPGGWVVGDVFSSKGAG